MIYKMPTKGGSVAMGVPDPVGEIDVETVPDGIPAALPPREMPLVLPAMGSRG
jgi:hypothetical protein